MIEGIKNEVKVQMLRKYLEITNMMLSVITAGDFDAFESLIFERQKLVDQGNDVVVNSIPEIEAIARLIESAQVEVDKAFEKYRSDVNEAYMKTKKDLKATEYVKKVDDLYRGGSLNSGNVFDYKK